MHRRRVERHVLPPAEGAPPAAVLAAELPALRIDANVGMLSANAAGYYPWRDADVLASVSLRSRATLGALACGDNLMQHPAQCRERAGLRRLLADLPVQDKGES